MAKRRATGAPRRKAQIGWWLAGALALVALVGVYWVSRPEPEVDLEAWLAEKELVLNPGFAAHYRPGTVVRTHTRGADGAVRALARPEVLLWGEQCFPGQAPRSAAFPLPTARGRREASMRVAGPLAKKLLPTLELEGARSWQLEAVRPRLESFALADLNRRFSEACLDALEPMLDQGLDSAWLAVVLEALVADELGITVEWEAGAGAEVRGRAAARAAAEAEREGLKVAAEGRAEGAEVLHAAGPVVVAFRLKPMVPVR